MYVYEDGVVVGFDHVPDNYQCRNGCVNPKIHDEVERQMVASYHKRASTTKVRLGKVGKMEGSTVDIVRLANE